jgi:hypothetical protein
MGRKLTDEPHTNIVVASWCADLPIGVSWLRERQDAHQEMGATILNPRRQRQPTIVARGSDGT